MLALVLGGGGLGQAADVAMLREDPTERRRTTSVETTHEHET
jgi:hypothetical protein